LKNAIQAQAQAVKRKPLLLLFSALLVPFAARAQTNPPAPQPPKASIEDDPQFKRLSPDQQEFVRRAMQNLDKAVAQERKDGANPGTKPGSPVQPAQPGCVAIPAKKPRFHLPKAVQDALDKQAKQIGGKSGVDLDSKAPGQVLKDAQGKPCPPATSAKPTPAGK
jgi:hypothetical protein